MNPENINRVSATPPVNKALQSAPVAPVNVKPVQPTLLPGTRYSFSVQNLPEYTLKATFVGGVEPTNKDMPYEYKFKDVETYNKDGTIIQKQNSYTLSYNYNFPKNFIPIDGVPNIGVGGRLKKRRSKHRTKKSTRRYGRKRKSRRFHRL